MTTSAERMAKLREKAKARGWVRRDYYATDSEHNKLRKLLELLRKPKVRKAVS